MTHAVEHSGCLAAGQVLGSEAAPGSVQHQGVQCDGCGQLPIQGPRYRSTTRDDYDLCGRCRGGARGDANGPYARVAGQGECRMPADY